MEKTGFSTTSYLSGLAVGAWSLSFNELIALAGLCIALGTFAVNLIYKHLHYRLAKKRLEGTADHVA